MFEIKKYTVENRYFKEYPDKKIFLKESAEKVLKEANKTIYIIDENKIEENVGLAVLMDSNAVKMENLSQKEYDDIMNN